MADNARELASAIFEVFKVLESGAATADDLRQAAAEASLSKQELQAALVWIDVAATLHSCPDEERPRPAITVANPRYRKGTSMKPSSWENCLWKPMGRP